MQDRFKFRVWDKEQNRFHHSFSCDITASGTLVISQGIESKKYIVDDDNYVVQQCTGLKDKNGKLIYEGDIVQFYDDEFLQTMKIIWDNDELDFKAIGLKKSVECYEEDFSYLGYIKKEDSLEVIGNIYENPELIGGVK